MTNTTHPEREAKLMEAIKAGIEANGFAPSLRELGKVIGVSSTSMIRYYLNRLINQGKLHRAPRTARGLTLAGYKVRLEEDKN